MTDSPVALITGASSGIGAATAHRLLREGYRVTVTGRDRGRLARFAVALDEPAELLTVVADAAEYDAVEAAVDATVGAFGRLDVAIANAGFGTHDTVADGNPAGWRDMVLTNQIAEAIAWTVSQPAGVDVNTVTLRPVGQAV